jgi:hypothetical protein
MEKLTPLRSVSPHLVRRLSIGSCNDCILGVDEDM